MKNKPLFVIPAAVFLISFVAFVLLRSNDFFVVDGSFRCLEVFRYPSLFFRSNNHLLYTPNAYAWTRLATLAGFKLAGPIQFLRCVEVMNSLAGAAALTIYCSLVFGATGSWRIAIAATAGLGLTRAFFAQATNSDEPMPGILWSFAGISLAVHAARKQSVCAALASGLLFGLAMATYRSMILLAPAAALLLLIDTSNDPLRITLAKNGIARTAIFSAAAFVSISALHAWAYWTMGERTLAGLISRFGVTDGSQFYFGLRWSRTLNLPIGIARNFFAVEPDFIGIRPLLDGPMSAVAVMAILILAILGFLVFCAWEIWKAWPTLPNRERTAALAAGVGLAFTFIPVLLWDAQYDKLWVLPLACIFILAAIAFNHAHWGGAFRKSVASIFAIVALWGAGITLHWTYVNHTTTPIEFAEAQQAVSLFGKNDFVIGDWRPVAMLYGYLYADPDHFLSFPSEAVVGGHSAIAHVQSAVKETQARGGRIFFFDTLDMPKQDWNVFFRRTPDMTYAAFDDYRAQASVRTRFLDRHGYDNLWELK